MYVAALAEFNRNPGHLGRPDGAAISFAEPSAKKGRRFISGRDNHNCRDAPNNALEEILTLADDRPPFPTRPLDDEFTTRVDEAKRKLTEGDVRSAARSLLSTDSLAPVDEHTVLKPRSTLPRHSSKAKGLRGFW